MRREEVCDPVWDEAVKTADPKVEQRIVPALMGFVIFAMLCSAGFGMYVAQSQKAEAAIQSQRGR